MEQIAPSCTGAPQFGHRFASTSPQNAQYLPPTGSAADRSGRRYVRPSTEYAVFVGHDGLGQNPRARISSKGGNATSTGFSSATADVSNEIPNLSASRRITASLSFVPSPCSNIDKADCLHPTSVATTCWESFAARRASLIFRQISGLKSITGAYYGLYFINWQVGDINIINRIINL